MAKFGCACGHVTRISGESDNEFYLVSEPLLWEIESRLRNNNMTVDGMHTMIIDFANDVYRCEKCHRLYIHDVENERLVIKRYVLEETIRLDDDDE